MLLGDGSRQRRGQAEDGKEREAAGRAHVRRLLATERPGLPGPETTTPDRQAVGRPKGFGGADATGIQPTLSTIEQSRAILRVVVDAMASAMNAGQSVQ